MGYAPLVIERTPAIDPRARWRDEPLGLPAVEVGAVRAAGRQATPYDGGVLYPYRYRSDERVLRSAGDDQTIAVLGTWVERALAVPADGTAPFERCYERPPRVDPATVGVLHRRRHQVR